MWTSTEAVMEPIVEILVKPALLGFIGAVPSNEQDGLMNEIYNLIPYWAWLFIAAIAFVVTILISATDYVKRKERAARQPASQNTNTAKSGGFAQQNTNNSNSFNTTNYNTLGAPFVGYESPTRKQLIRRIGVDIQKFHEQFKPIRYKPVNDKYDQWLVANGIFEVMHKELLPHANIELKSTPVPNLFIEIARNLTRYSLQISDQAQAEADRLYHIKHGGRVPKDVVIRINDIENTIGRLDEETDSMIKKLVDFASNHDENW